MHADPIANLVASFVFWIVLVIMITLKDKFFFINRCRGCTWIKKVNAKKGDYSSGIEYCKLGGTLSRCYRA